MKNILSHGPRLRREIRRRINDERAGLGRTNSWQADFLERLTPYATSGKLLRGCLINFSYEAFSGRQPDRGVMDVAVAMELLHSALLIHDDVMDGDDQRRGKPAMHKQYSDVAAARNIHEPDRFGTNMAICGADMCMFMAMGLLSGQPEPVHDLFSRILMQVCDGQMQDIHQQYVSKEPSKKQIFTLMRSKTASYSLSLPLAAGAMLAGEESSVISKLKSLGDQAGLIFQIRDDELGVLGDAERTGKPVGADIREGKKTLLRHYLIKSCDQAERRRLGKIFGNPDASPADIAWVQALIIKRGVPGLLNDDIRTLERKALGALDRLDLADDKRDELRSLISFCAARQA